MPDATTDERALLAAIADDPADDTVRLAYADFLDETGEPERMARAELIRAQCERSRCENCAILPPNVTPAFDCGHDTHRRREAAILARHPDWLRVTCPACEGQGYLEWSAEDGGSPPMKCPFCPTKNRTVGTGHLPVTLRRGFEYRVTVPKLGQVGAEGIKCRACGDTRGIHGRQYCYVLKCQSSDLVRVFRPTDHARDLLAALPTCGELVPGDRKPLAMTRGAFIWSYPGTHPAALPDSLFDILRDEFSTEEAAISALGVTLCGIVRGSA